MGSFRRDKAGRIVRRQNEGDHTMLTSKTPSLTIRALIVALSVLCVSTTRSSDARADDGPTAATARVYQRLLDHFDANHDGRLQTSELPASLRERLGQADTDHDGVITPQELHTFGVQRRAARFAKADKNGDGKLEPSEVGPARWAHLKVADADGDGKVTLDEIERAIASGTLTSSVDDD
jgi:Ca2+-binding EF-hand superfamily protein